MNADDLKFVGPIAAMILTHSVDKILREVDSQ